MKKLTAIVLSIVLLLASAFPASAAALEPVSPYYINTSQASISFGIHEDGSSSWAILCAGKSSTTGISSVTYLEIQMGARWVRMDLGTTNDEYVYSVSTKYLLKSYEATVVLHGTYRAVVEFTVYGTSEDETFSLYKLCDY